MLALLVRLEKVAESEFEARYRFDIGGGRGRYLVLDKRAETITPDDGDRDGVFRAAAKLASTWSSTGSLPDRLVVQS